MNKQTVLRNLAGSDSPPVLVVEDQSVRDIIKLITYKHKKEAGEYDRIAGIFWRGNVYDTCEALWNFCKDNIRYGIESKEVQTVSPPYKILTRRSGDCKHYSLFTAGVLDALNRQGHVIDWVYRFASYNPFDESPGHVFVVVNDPKGDEIWIDPVLNSFDEHKPFFYATDKKVTASKQKTMSGIILPHSRPYGSLGLSRITGYGVLQGTTSQTGTQIMKIAPALAVVPVVGWIGSAAAEVVGGIISIVGSKWSQSPDVRWLTQLYEYYVLGNKGATSDNKTNPADDHVAQAYFSVVLGVPIGGRKDFNILQSGDGNSNHPTSQTAQQRAQNYLAFKNLAGQIPIADAINAATIAANMNPYNAQAGGWAGLTAAPWTVSQDTSGHYSAIQNTPAAGTMTAGLFAGLPSWAMWAIAGGLILMIMSGGPKHHHTKKRKS